ncbi:MAG: aminoglycoside phosphotransferase family protein [Actinomycetaceae bacterium]|nr:aminoglycoside phosphotransferase family protein [Actinomycetaceae bacterium]
MSRSLDAENPRDLAGHFAFPGVVVDVERYGSGHINDTYRVRTDGEPSFHILQRINSAVFPRPIEVMENFVSVTNHLARVIEQSGGDPRRETLQLVPTCEGKPFHVDAAGEVWRATQYIRGARTYDLCENPEHFYQSGVAFGTFQQRLADYPAHDLHETIPAFHDTNARLAAFRQVVEEDPLGRAEGVREEIDFFLSRPEVATRFGELEEAGEVPLRVTHNDTKLNNVMIDDATGRAVCVIDLDTVMPGLAMNDFGDSIRFGASTAEEDEPDLSKVSCSMELFARFTEGFLTGTAGSLTPREVAELPHGAKVMTYECGMRFLGDYLAGDTYFKIARPRHNLDRARTQMTLVADMERKWDEMGEIVDTLSRKN